MKSDARAAFNMMVTAWLARPDDDPDFGLVGELDPFVMFPDVDWCTVAEWGAITFAAYLTADRGTPQEALHEWERQVRAIETEFARSEGDDDG